eukprot:symbB.v1.2.005078.t1/scaffold292.1/size239810/22
MVTEPLLDFLEDLPCEFCQEHSVERRLLMEVSMARSAEALHRSVKGEGGSSPTAAKDLRLAEVAQEELLRHRRHTAFYKVVARDPEGDGRSFLSIYDGTTRYKLGLTTYDRSGGFFVHSSEEQASRSMQGFPRHSAAWAVPRTILLVRGEGRVRLKHGKVLFDGLTPLMEVSGERRQRQILRSPWRF